MPKTLWIFADGEWVEVGSPPPTVTDWIYFGTYPGDPGTTPDSPPFQNSWANTGSPFSPAAVRINIDELEFKGDISGGLDGTEVVDLSVIGTDYVPAYTIRTCGALTFGGGLAIIEVDDTGSMTVTAV